MQLYIDGFTVEAKKTHVPRFKSDKRENNFWKCYEIQIDNTIINTYLDTNKGVYFYFELRDLDGNTKGWYKISIFHADVNTDPVMGTIKLSTTKGSYTDFVQYENRFHTNEYRKQQIYLYNMVKGMI